FDNEHLEVVEDPREWPEYSGQKVAGVSGFGFGGTNAHIVRQRAPRSRRGSPRVAGILGPKGRRCLWLRLRR
ncbi:hypothetical protein HT105_25465, partial [Bacteroides fragilis]|nr:hypothetical protein [Bacteroides fragilis]